MCWNNTKTVLVVIVDDPLVFIISIVINITVIHVPLVINRGCADWWMESQVDIHYTGCQTQHVPWLGEMTWCFCKKVDYTMLYLINCSVFITCNNCHGRVRMDKRSLYLPAVTGLLLLLLFGIILSLMDVGNTKK